jgi:hypothetical protein
VFAGHCQCRDCQEASGGGHSSVIAFPSASIEMTGTPVEWGNRADSGAHKVRAFCGKCGSPIYVKIDSLPGVTIVKAGSLDDPSVFQPQMVIYAKRAQRWDHVDPALPRFEAMPPHP